MKAKLEPRINLQGRTPLETVIPLATPFIVFVDPASACNFKCTFCPTGHHDLIAETGRFQGAMKFELFQKIIDDLAELDRPLKVLRLYKDGEPFLTGGLPIWSPTPSVGPRRLCGHHHQRLFDLAGAHGALLAAEFDKINISVDGMTADTFRKFTGFQFDFDASLKMSNGSTSIGAAARLWSRSRHSSSTTPNVKHSSTPSATIVIASSSRTSLRAGRSLTSPSIPAWKSPEASTSRISARPTCARISSTAIRSTPTGW